MLREAPIGGAATIAAGTTTEPGARPHRDFDGWTCADFVTGGRPATYKPFHGAVIEAVTGQLICRSLPLRVPSRRSAHSPGHSGRGALVIYTFRVPPAPLSYA